MSGKGEKPKQAIALSYDPSDDGPAEKGQWQSVS